MARWASPELVSAALSGDEGATEQLIAAVWPGCFRLAATVIGDRSLAQDAAQEACVVVHRKIHGLRREAAFDAWLYRIVMRESARVRRRHQAVGQATFEDCLGIDDTATVDVWRALADLSPELRDVTVLFYFDDLKSDEIAAALGIAHPTVRTRLLRAREHLRGLLGDYRDAPMPEPKEMKQHAF
ncbi:MAG TPA: sigma-70 family RNA polymerase sigma factor [Candidatus Baltobacteraceae bacterium]